MAFNKLLKRQFLKRFYAPSLQFIGKQLQADLIQSSIIVCRLVRSNLYKRRN